LPESAKDWIGRIGFKAETGLDINRTRPNLTSKIWENKRVIFTSGDLVHMAPGDIVFL
jgi:hypothetical protein